MIFYRDLCESEHPAGVVGPSSGEKGVDRITMIVGCAWFNREKGRSARYAHGRVSLPEMIFPGVVLYKLDAPEGIRLTISKPERLRGQEDEGFDAPVTVKNAGTVLASVR